MEKNKPKFQPWTREEMALLADLMGKAFNAGNNQTEAATFAATKLGRTPNACLGMYHSKMRKKPLSIWALEEPTVSGRSEQLCQCKDAPTKHFIKNWCDDCKKHIV